MSPRREDWIEVLAIAVIIAVLGIEWPGLRTLMQDRLIHVQPCCEVTLIGR
jgi:hypothetical protein